MDRVTNVLVLEENTPGFERVKRQVLAWHANALLVRAADLKQLRARQNWAVFDFVLVNFGLSDYGGLQVLMFVRARFPDMPFIFVVDKSKKYSEADIAIIRQADGCVYVEDIFGQVGIIDDLVAAAVDKVKSGRLALDQRTLVSSAISLIRLSAGFEGRKQVLSLLERCNPGSRAQYLTEEVKTSGAGHRSAQEEAHGDDPHVLGGAAAGAGGFFEA